MRRCTSIAIAGILLSATAAEAADVVYDAPMLASPEVVANSLGWSGLYVGGQAGGLFSDGTNDVLIDNDVDGLFNQPSDGIDDFFSNADNGFVGGVHVGYDMQYGSLVLGGVADLSFVDFSETRGFTTVFGNTTSVTRDIDMLATARIRAGLALDSLLIYGTGGLAYGHVEQNFAPAEVGGLSPVSSLDEDGFGYTVGGGAEFMATSNISFGAEYLYTNLGSDDSYAAQVDAGGIVRSEGYLQDDVDFHTVWAKLSYRFR
jgi:outer membrane immunogenic protein